MDRFLAFLAVLIIQFPLVGANGLGYFSLHQTSQATTTNEAAATLPTTETTALQQPFTQGISRPDPADYKKTERSPTAIALPDPVEMNLVNRDIKEKELSDHELSALLDGLPMTVATYNSLGTDTITLEHKKSLVYQALIRLPTAQQQALQQLVLQEVWGETRGLGGQGTIILQMGGLRDAELVAVFIHEMGHVVDANVLKNKTPFDFASRNHRFMDGREVIYPNDPSWTFYNLSWNSNTARKQNSSRMDFVSGYALTDPFEDFAESYVFYILHGREFRSLLPTSSVLAAKYAFLKSYVFDGEEYDTGTELENVSLRSFDATLVSFDLREFFGS